MLVFLIIDMCQKGILSYRLIQADDQIAQKYILQFDQVPFPLLNKKTIERFIRKQGMN